MRNSNTLIDKRIDTLLHAGALVDIYHLAEVMKRECPELTVEVLAQKIANSVTTHHGNAVWGKLHSDWTKQG